MNLSHSDKQTKEMIIEKLISQGIYKIKNHQLFELTLKELLNEWKKYDEK